MFQNFKLVQFWMRILHIAVFFGLTISIYCAGMFEKRAYIPQQPFRENDDYPCPLHGMGCQKTPMYQRHTRSISLHTVWIIPKRPYDPMIQIPYMFGSMFLKMDDPMIQSPFSNAWRLPCAVAGPEISWRTWGISGFEG